MAQGYAGLGAGVPSSNVPDDKSARRSFAHAGTLFRLASDAAAAVAPLP